MGAVAQQQFTPEDTIALIQERAKISGDRFRVHVYRRHHQTGQVTQVAGLDAATVDHIADPARWLPPLLGGGEYLMHVFHSTEQAGQRLGGALPANYDSKPGTAFGPSKAVPDIKFMRSEAWTGPMILTSPPEEQILAELERQQQADAALGGPGQRKTTLAMLRGGGAQNVSADVPPPTGNAAVDYVAQKEREIAMRERELNESLARQAREIAAKEAEVRRIESESRLRNEIAQQTNELKNSLSHLTAKLETPRAPDTSMKDIIGALAPIVTSFMTTQAQMRADMVKFEQENARRREEAEAKRAEADAKRHEEALKMQLEILKAQSVRPGMSDEMKMLIETLKNDKSNSSVDAMAAMMTRMVDAVGVVSKMSINMIETVAEQMGGDPEDPVVTAIKEGTKAMMMLTQGGQSAANRIVPGPRQQQAQPQPQAARPAQPQQARPAPQQQQQQQPQAARPAAVVTPVPQHPVAPQPQLAGAPAPAPVAPDNRSKMDLLEAAIRGNQPAEDIARILVAMVAQKEPSLQAELAANENNPNHVIYARLGEKWIMEHGLYLKELGTAFDRMGAEAGLFEEDEGEDVLTNDEPPEPAPEPAAPEAPGVPDALSVPAAPAPAAS